MSRRTAVWASRLYVIILAFVNFAIVHVAPEETRVNLLQKAIGADLDRRKQEADKAVEKGKSQVRKLFTSLSLF